ncbi:MAG: hypothetical protein COS84_03215 [Armatimonadetes bacterium CG07_land_8_20_14_0_80_40_9]|nr:MAG: hypothetical protein COS84_03215 [Armatimonadetes bacterium CG07_land_8_20_14_0_80_40_9]
MKSLKSLESLESLKSFWIPAPRFRGDKFRGNDNCNWIPTGFPLPAFAGTSFAGMTKGAGMTIARRVWRVWRV